MKLFKTIVIIWIVLLGILIALFLFKDIKKKKIYKQFKKWIEDEDDKDNKERFN